MLVHQFLSRADSSSPVVVLVHGRSGNLQVMQIFKSLVSKDVNLLAVQAPVEDEQGGYCWWQVSGKPDFASSDKEKASAAADLFARWLRELLQSEDLQPTQILGVGFSQGAALLSCVVQSNPALLQGIAMLAGFTVEITSNPTNSDHYSLPAVFMAHGTSDEIVPFALAEAGKKYFESLGAKVELVSDNVAHKIGVNGMKGLKNWLSLNFSRSGEKFSVNKVKPELS